MKRTLLYLLVPLSLLAQGGFRGPGRYEIYSPLSRKVLDMDRNDRRTIIQYESRHTDNQTWDVNDAGGGFYNIRNAMNGNALAVQDDRNSSPLVAEPFNNSAAQQWRIDTGDDNSAILVNRNGKAIDIPFGSTNNGQKINSYNKNNEVNQRWQFQPVAGYTGNTNPNRYDPVNANRPDSMRPGRGPNRYETNPNVNTGGNTRRDSFGMYFDDRDRMYKMDGDGVCVYSQANYQGDAVCAPVRGGRARWDANFTTIGSVKFFGRATGVQVFDRDSFKGNSTEITGDQPTFGRGRNRMRGNPQSLRAY